jgi:hypothetical protein
VLRCRPLRPPLAIPPPCARGYVRNTSMHALCMESIVLASLFILLTATGFCAWQLISCNQLFITIDLVLMSTDGSM